MSSPPPPRRSLSTPAVSTPAVPVAAQAVLGDRQQEFGDLIARRDALQKRRGSIEARLNLAETTIEECRKEAQQYGVSSLDELRALIAQQEESERKGLAEFQAALDAEEQLLQSIESETA